ncbi:shikimate dehydrogenase [Oxyplasma meridianum]|uniref:Shikimate dehydrogenase n=1 Tax=Oxyplasma meridianum TaxID=3073602 RepID=A0AAX4NI20_9ARCH
MKFFGLIGRPVGQSTGQFIFNRIFSSKGYDSIYISMDIAKENLQRFAQFASETMSGFNVTMPHKVDIIKLLDSYDPVVTSTLSCNTVVNSEGNLNGYNTDYSGFLKSIVSLKNEINGKRILIAGTGGIFRSVCTALFSEFRPESVTALSRNPEAAEMKLSSLPWLNRIRISNYENIDEEYHVIINCSPVGMYPDVLSMPFSESMVLRSETVIDTVYNPYETALIKTGARNGKRCITGLDLYIYQAVESLKILTGIASTYSEVRGLVEEAWKSREFGKN